MLSSTASASAWLGMIDEVLFESDDEKEIFQSLTDIFGQSRRDDIRRIFAEYRNHEPKDDRLMIMIDALNAVLNKDDLTDDDEVIIVGEVSEDDAPWTDALLDSSSVSVKPKRQRSSDDEAKPPTAPPVTRGDTEIYEADLSNVVRVENPSVRPKKAKFLTDANRSVKIFEFLANLHDNEDFKNLFDPNVVYNRLDGSLDFERECTLILDEMKPPVVRDNVEFVGASAFPVKLQRQDTSDATEAEIQRQARQGGTVTHMRHEFADVEKQVNEILQHVPITVHRDELFFRLAVAENLEEEKERIITEVNVPGTSASATAGTSLTTSVVRTNSNEFLAETLADEEKTAMKEILAMFPDVDPHHVLKELAERRIRPEELVERLSGGNYPKFKDRLEERKREERRQQFLDPATFDMEEFLRTFGDDPETYFSNTSKPMSDLYRQHAFVQLRNDFPCLDEGYLNEELRQNNNHYLPTFRAVQRSVRTGLGPTRKHRKKHSHIVGYLPNGQERREELPYPDQIDELFFKELQFVKYEVDITEHMERKNETRRRRLEVARLGNLLQECSCCFSNEVLPEEMLSCSEGGHSFCSVCVRLHAEEIIKQARSNVTCIERECNENFKYALLRELLAPRLMNLLLRQNQMAEIRQAGIENVESCPFCDFLLIMENELDRVFCCRNPECLRESCRLCKEPNHVPLKCEEVEKANETAMRTFVENRMAEALIRTCPRCGKRLVKEDGCNKLKCPCGTNICYVCRQDIGPDGTAYAHFQGQGRMMVFGDIGDGDKIPKAGKSCVLHTSTSVVHDEPVEKAGEKAKKEFLKVHPELEGRPDVDLKKLMDKEDNERKRRGGEFHLFHRRRPLPHRHRRLDLLGPGDDSDDDDDTGGGAVAGDELYFEMMERRVEEDVREAQRFGPYRGLDPETADAYFRERQRRMFPMMPPVIRWGQMDDAAVRRRRQNVDVTVKQVSDKVKVDAAAKQQRNEELEEIRNAQDLFELFDQAPREPAAAARAADAQPGNVLSLIDFIDTVDDHPILLAHPVNVANAVIADHPYLPIVVDQPQPIGEENEEIMRQINELREFLNTAQIRLCKKQRAIIRGDDNDDDLSLQQLMKTRDSILIKLHVVEERALHNGIPENVVMQNQDFIISNSEIEHSVEEARAMMQEDRQRRIQNEQQAAAERREVAQRRVTFYDEDQTRMGGHLKALGQNEMLRRLVEQQNEFAHRQRETMMKLERSMERPVVVAGYRAETEIRREQEQIKRREREMNLQRKYAERRSRAEREIRIEQQMEYRFRAVQREAEERRAAMVGHVVRTDTHAVGRQPDYQNRLNNVIGELTRVHNIVGGPEDVRRAAFTGLCEIVANLALEVAPQLNSAAWVTELIDRGIDDPVSAEMKKRFSEIVHELLVFLRQRQRGQNVAGGGAAAAVPAVPPLRYFGRAVDQDPKFLYRSQQLTPQQRQEKFADNDGGSTVQGDNNARARVPVGTRGFQQANKAVIMFANETVKMNQQLNRVNGELTAVREQLRILEGRRDDLLTTQRRLTGDIDARKEQEAVLKKRRDDLRPPPKVPLNPYFPPLSGHFGVETPLGYCAPQTNAGNRQQQNEAGNAADDEYCPELRATVQPTDLFARDLESFIEASGEYFETVDKPRTDDDFMTFELPGPSGFILNAVTEEEIHNVVPEAEKEAQVSRDVISKPASNEVSRDVIPKMPSNDFGNFTFTFGSNDGPSISSGNAQEAPQQVNVVQQGSSMLQINLMLPRRSMSTEEQMENKKE